MRDIIDIITEAALTEGGVEKISIRNGMPFSVYQNPSRAVVVNMGPSMEFRGVIADDDLYIWDAFDGTHDDVAQELMIDWQIEFKVKDNKVDNEEALAHRRFRRAFGDGIEAVLEEMPIQSITRLGDWDKSSSFRDGKDRKLLTSEKAIQKMKAMWKYPDEVDYNILLINNAEANRHTEVGVVPRDKLASMFPKTISAIEPLLRDDQVNIIFTNNKGAARVPLTGWVMAHRFGHAMQRFGTSYYFDEAVKELDKALGELMVHYGARPNDKASFRRPSALNSTNSRGLLHALCTFRSAREKKLRNSMEAVHELFAQYIFTGRIKFNPIPRHYQYGSVNYSFRGDEEDYEAEHDLFAETVIYNLENYFETAIHNVVGKVLVM
ncbi:MAG: hypothetical protein EOO77_19735 [Oxalobacteraceae bacterium]|nr:MAG: hypothetical protein EOO77_19735 [Oxalobacteraceae bacterium]